MVRKERWTLEGTINELTNKLTELKNRGDIENIKISIESCWLGGYYETEFEVNYILKGEE